MLFRHQKEDEYELFLRKEVLKCAKDIKLSLQEWFNQLENTISIYLIIESLLINAILMTIPLMCNICDKIVSKKIIYLLYFIDIIILLVSLFTTLCAKKLRFVKFERNPKDLYDILEKQLLDYKKNNK